MAGNIFADNSGDVLVEFDYNNIIVVDPNKTIDSKGTIRERLVDHENLVMYANLEADLLPRTKLAVGGAPTDRYRTVSIGKLNFLKPSKENYLSTRYYDQLTGKNSSQGQGINQGTVSEQLDPQGNSYFKRSVNQPNDIIDTGLLGITQISVTTNSSFVPAVTIEMEDIQGKALFELGENSPYAAFFNLPYPQFYLTLKGYYGQAIRYQLNLEKFNARFNSFSGNYQVSLEFRGYKFNILNEISIGHLLATPHMYSQLFTTTSNVSTNSPDNVVSQVSSERGYQKIREVYSEYKSKGLIPTDLPELTVSQLINKLENFENYILNSYNEVDILPLTNIRNYKGALKKFYDSVRGVGNSWFNKYMNPSPIITLDGNSIYFFKENLDQGNRLKAITELAALIIEYTKVLDENPTLGVNGNAKIPNKIKSEIFKVDTAEVEIDWEKTTTSISGTLAPTTEQVFSFRNNFNKQFPKVIEVTNGEFKLVPPIFFIFEGAGRFENEIKSMDSRAVKVLSYYETKLSADLANKIEDKDNGIGFKPTVRNMIGVLMASAEAFIRLMEEVHTNAWNVRQDPVRKNAILYNSKTVPSSDAVQNISVAQQFAEIGVDVEDPVYPWPQFFVESMDEKKGKYQLTYLADPSVVNLTQAYLYEKWPEVEFVEEYMKGLEKKFEDPYVEDPLSDQNYINLININAIEIPNDGVAYLNKEEVKFFYEIWERQFLTANYTGLIRENNGLVQEVIELVVKTEVENIVNRLGLSSPFITFKLKNYAINAINYQNDVLRNFSNNGIGKSYQTFIRDFYVTQYIKDITENPFQILQLKNLGKVSNLKTDITVLQNLIKSTNNSFLIIDTIPFTNQNWVANNMANAQSSQGNQVFNTTNSLKVYEELNVLSNFTDLYNYTENRPVTNFSYTKIQQNPTPSLINLQTFYLTRKTTDFIPTEGNCTFTSPVNQLNILKTTSMLNTPFFVNAIQLGVKNQQSQNPYPYVEAAYLFLNSLPLASLKEKYKKLDNEVEYSLDYIASVFKKYGALHKIPYAWVLKIGSIWHRYKKFVDSNVDILDEVWKNFDFQNNFNPKDSNFSGYTFSYQGTTKKIPLQETNGASSIQNVGFYPKVIDDFTYFYNGYVLFENYTNQEVQNSVNLGLKLYNFGSSNMNGVDYNSTQIDQTTWSVVVPNLSFNLRLDPTDCVKENNTQSTEYLIVPSFGTNINQGYSECVEKKTTTNTSKVNLIDNPNIFNGSIRLLWGAPNYGYFDVSQSVKPQVNSYINFFNSNQEQSPFKILSYNGYSKIEEVFSVFERRILDKMEEEFLNFSKPNSNIDYQDNSNGFGGNNVDVKSSFRNFQTLFKSLMTVPARQNESEDEYFSNLIQNQLDSFSNTIKSFMNFDVILRCGNPSNYRRRIFNSYLSHNSSLQRVTDPITFDSYIPGSLPGDSLNTTLGISINQNLDSWKTLQLEVGFSTIEGVVYSDTGSTITDFFIDNNIGFTSENIILLAPIIKMYATQKPTQTLQEFKQNLTDYLESTTDLQLNILNSLLIRLNNELPNQQQLPEKTIQSVIDGQQSKLENYEMFKALNDKWIAGNDYIEKTLFEDMLFLDRASRNIGDILIIDIFGLRDMFTGKAVNPSMSVFTLISGLLIKNNFTVMNLPAYVNFYNVQDTNSIEVTNPEGSLDFANNMWGTFLNVDYRNSSPKMVCFFVGKPSEYLDLPKHNFRFRNDGLELNRTGNPLIENQDGKKDWALSNKCVGFNVDIGTRNQNIFYSFTVSQDSGKATSESIQTQLNMVNQAGGNSVATQNVSLYNLYKQRSYQCSVVSLGNALIQPTMYFNLRHVPMFNGPYLITNVQHQITAGDFQTTFSGIRQGIFDLPLLDQLIQQVNRNLLTKLEQLIKSRKETVTSKSSTYNNKRDEVVQKSENSVGEQNSCVDKVLEKYKNNSRPFVSVNAQPTSLTPKQMADLLNAKFPANELTRTVIYAICYVTTYNGTNSFVGYNNNFASVALNNEYGSGINFFDRKYTCINVKPSVSLPVVGFATVDKFLEFMESRITENLGKIRNIGLQQFYICDWPVTNSIDADEYKNNKAGFTTLEENLFKGIQSAVDAGVLTYEQATTIGFEMKNSNASGKDYPSATPRPSQLPIDVTQECLPPVINSFSPLTGQTGTIIELRGSNFTFVKSIQIKDIIVDSNSINVLSENVVRFSIPQTNFPKPYVGNIFLLTENGTARTTDSLEIL